MATKRREKVTFAEIVTDDDRMKECLAVARTAAKTDASILILGETGVGKTLLAFAIHNASKRAGGPMVNCSAVSESLIESELFGHEQGAFTSADRDRRGKFEQAANGTLFLDEIGNLSPSTQAKILRAVEDKEFERIGGEETIVSDCRIIAATNMTLDDLLHSGRFRQDLFYRLSEIVVELPSLRERKKDIPVLISSLVAEFAGEFGKDIKSVSDVTLNFLLHYEWPGNIRELRNVVRHGVMNATRDTIWLEDLNLRIQTSPETSGLGAEDGDLSLDRAERDHIFRVLEMTSWNKKKACEVLKISRPTLDRKLKKYEAFVPTGKL